MSQDDVRDALRTLGPAKLAAILEGTGLSASAAGQALTRMKMHDAVIYHKDGRSGTWGLIG